MPTISNTPRPGYVYDSTDNVWYPIGTGTHSHSEIASTIVDAKGDIIAATAADAVSRLAVGANGTVLTAASGQATGLEWATPSSGGMTLISTTTLSGSSTTLSSIPQTYNSLFLIISRITGNTSNKKLRCLPNNVNNLISQSGTKGNTGQKFDDSYIQLTGDADISRTDIENSWQLLITNYTSSTSFKPFQFSGFFVDQVINPAVNYGGSFRSNTAITSLVFDREGNTFTAGTILLYGVN